MAGNSRKLSEDALRMVADRFKALGEPMRLKLIMSLRDREKNVGELVEEVVATQANVSRHLQYLTEAGILKRRKEGLHVYYSISDPRVFDLCQVVCGSLEQHFSDRARAFK
jgi:DNA-binding transcriptional ArsR family regulator